MRSHTENQVMNSSVSVLPESCPPHLQARGPKYDPQWHPSCSSSKRAAALFAAAAPVPCHITRELCECVSVGV
jgi:hypothetical protein